MNSRNMASRLLVTGSQVPISFSTLVLDACGVGVGGTGVEVGGTGVEVGGTGAGVGGGGAAAGALHPTRNKRSTVISTNGRDNLW